MSTPEIILIVLASLIFIVSIVIVLLLLKQKQSNEGALLKELQDRNNESLKQTRLELQESFHAIMRSLGQNLTETQDKNAKSQSEKVEFLTNQLMKDFDGFQTQIKEAMINQEKRQEAFNKNFLESLRITSDKTEERLEKIRTTVSEAITSLQKENTKKLDEMRNVVDEKLQKTLEERLAKSFNTVSTQLEAVHKGLGDMQQLAVGVGDLKKVLSNVKTRGSLGEIQLGNILEQLLSPEQYEKNIVTKKGTANPVEFAIKFPGDDEHPVYLPIDAKFPMEDYQRLLEAYEQADQVEVTKHLTLLTRKIKVFAKDIHDKYIDVPNTTDFGIMFLPLEGLYAEVVKAGMVEELQRLYKINIAGPTTMAALLNSLQMGFRTLAIQKRSHEVWKVLGAVKTEFGKFGDVLSKAREKLRQADDELDNLIGRRTRVINRKLKTITQLDEGTSSKVLDIPIADQDDE